MAGAEEEKREGKVDEHMKVGDRWTTDRAATRPPAEAD